MKKLLIAPVVAAGCALLLVIAAFTSEPSTATVNSNASPASCNLTATGKLTAAEVAGYAFEAGFSDTKIDPGTGKPDLVVITAISQPESGANSDTIQQGQPEATTGEGVWQDTPPQPGDLDPETNAQHVYAKFETQGFGAWTTYQDGLEVPWFGWAEQGVAAFLASGECQGSAGTLAGGVTPVASVTQESLTPVEPGAPFCKPALAAGDVSDPCSGGIAGQCTWWAAFNFPVDWGPPPGNAAQWWPNSPAAQHSASPALGDVVVWGSGFPGSGGNGHVAIVIGVSSNSITVSEMNYLHPGVVDERTDPLPDQYIEGYIARAA